MNNKETEIKNWYLGQFDNLKNLQNEDLQTLRTKAVKNLQAARFPTKKDEEWKYININPIIKNKFSPAHPDNAVHVDIIEDYTIGNLDTFRFVFINGHLSGELSSASVLNDGIIIDSLSNLSASKNPVIKKLIDKKNTSSQNNIFNLLNSAFLQDGFVLYVPEGKTIDKPIHVLNIVSSNSNKQLIQPKNFIYLEENTQAEIILEYVSLRNTEYFTNAHTEISIGKNAKLNLYKIQNESPNAFHVERTDIEQKDASTLKHFSLSFGASISRNDINAFVDGEDIECNLNGLYLGNKNQQIDHHTFIEHTKPNSVSNELYKGILDNESNGIFSGKILVQKEAQKTNAFQSNKSVLLSDKAKSNAKPQLEIYADDVKCSHGATVGKLDEEALFYIRSRGVPLELARSMLIRAFIDDVVKEIEIKQLTEKINHTIFQHLQRVEF